MKFILILLSIFLFIQDFSHISYSAELYKSGQESVIDRANKKAEKAPKMLSIALGIPTGSIVDIIPIYHPNIQHPIWMMAIAEYEGNLSMFIPYSYAYLYYQKSNLNITYRPLLHPGKLYHDLFQEPFKSDSLAQFYVYKGRLLLVGRNSDGIVSHWKSTFEIELSEKQVKTFLKDKWYNP